LCFAIFFTSCNNKSTDAELQKSVNTTLKNNDNYKGVIASVNNGVVSLNGSCVGENCITDIEKKIKEDKNVDSVINNIQQNPPPTDLTLRTSVQTIITNYPGVEADVANGVVVLRGSITRDHLTGLMDSISALHPSKIDNQMVVK
jgi:hyperosmotically inducible protein